MADITPKQQRFVDEYLVDLNATQAAIRAGYSKKTAMQQGSRLLSNAKVCAEVTRRNGKRTEKLVVNAEWLLQRLAAEATADLNDIYNEDGGMKPIKEWPLIWRQGLVAGVESDQQFEHVDGQKVPAGYLKKLKLSDRVKRLELLGRHIAVGAFVDKHEHTGKDGAALLPPPDDIEIAKRVAFILARGVHAVGESA